MDSMMIEANIRNLSCAELLYTCIAKLVIYLHDDLIAGLEHYYDPAEQIKEILGYTDQLLSKCGQDFDSVTEYQLLVRCLSEQTIVEDNTHRLREKADGGMSSSMTQNSSDPDATFRAKAGKNHRGYAANLDESDGSAGYVITDYQLEQNNYPDRS